MDPELDQDTEPDPEPDPLVRGTDPGIKSRIPDTADKYLDRSLPAQVQYQLGPETDFKPI